MFVSQSVCRLVLYMTVTANLSSLSPSSPDLYRKLHSSMKCHMTLYTSCRPESKEVIRPQVPLRPPCYDFSLVADPRFDNTKTALPRQESTSMKRRAVCARSRDVFT